MKNSKVGSVNHQGHLIVLVSLLFACCLLSPSRGSAEDGDCGPVNAAPCIGVSSTCDSVKVGQANLLTAVVTNCGLVSITNISVTDNLYGSIGTIASLAPGGTATLTRSVSNSCGNFPNVVTAVGFDFFIGNMVQAQSTNACAVAESPCIGVTKSCDTVLAGQPNLVTAVVTNCGDVPIHGITIVDNLFGSVGTIALLAPGGTATLTKSVTNLCGNFPNTVTATGLSPCNTSVTNTSTATCVVTENPCIHVTKTCDTVVAGQPNLVTAVVTNCGDVPIHGITIVDNLFGSVGTIALLAPGGTATLTKSVTNLCGNFPNTVTATGLSPCNTPITNTSTATCVVTENPCIRVTKTCDTVVAGQPNLVTAVVTNCGDVPIHGITIVDNLFGSVGTIALLAPGGTATLTKSVTNTCGNFPNTVTATGLSPCNTSVTNTSAATCVVLCPNQPPVARCTNIVVAADANCQGTGSVDDGSFDPDQGDTITLVQTPPGPYPLGTNNVTLCVTDNHGASNCCNAIVTVVDATPPDIHCPTNIVASTDPGQCSAVVSYTATASDGCVGGCTPYSQDFNTNPGGFIFLPSPPPPWIYSPVTGSWLVGQDVSLLGGGTPTGSILQSPPIVVTCAGGGMLTFVHRFTFQQGPWGGGDLQVSLNNGPFLALLPGDAAVAVPTAVGPVGSQFVTNVAGLGALQPGDVVQVRFVFNGSASGVVPGQVVPDGGPQGIPNWEITSVALTVPSGSASVPVVCDPPSGSTFPKGATTVTCTASDAAGNTNTCTFDVTVEDHEAPVAACREGVNPSGKKIPVAGKNPSSGQNPDGYYQLLGKDNCDADPAIYVGDTGSTFVAGPFHSGDVIKLTQSPGKTPSQDSAPAPIVAHVHLKGDGLLFAIDADGNVSEVVTCLVPRPPK